MTFENALKGIVNGLSVMYEPDRKFVFVFDKDGTTLGKVRPEAILYKADLVDMGLPSGTLWANKNVGAYDMYDDGWYLSWGNLNMHAAGSGYDFSQATYNTTDGAQIATDLSINQDAARANLGGGWRIPTSTQFGELFNTTYIKYIDANGDDISSNNDKRTTLNGVTGLYIQSKVNGNRLFFPGAGYYSGTTLGGHGGSGDYWSSTVSGATNARFLYFGASGVDPQNSNGRYYGRTLRPVQ